METEPPRSGPRRLQGPRRLVLLPPRLRGVTLPSGQGLGDLVHLRRTGLGREPLRPRSGTPETPPAAGPSRRRRTPPVLRRRLFPDDVLGGKLMLPVSPGVGLGLFLPPQCGAQPCRRPRVLLRTPTLALSYHLVSLPPSPPSGFLPLLLPSQVLDFVKTRS